MGWSGAAVAGWGYGVGRRDEAHCSYYERPTKLNRAHSTNAHLNRRKFYASSVTLGLEWKMLGNIILSFFQLTDLLQLRRFTVTIPHGTEQINFKP